MSFVIIGNWKGICSQANLLHASQYKTKQNIHYIIAPNYLHISYISKLQNINLCAQNSVQNELTGSVSISLLMQFNVKYMLCNHADHRANNNYNPTEHVLICEENSITPIIFIKDYQEAINLSNTLNKIKRKPNYTNENKSLDLLSYKSIFVFEPHDYIGKEGIADLNKVKYEIDRIKQLTDSPVCYGGSLNENNYKDLIPYVDGLCFGRLSRSANFNQIIENISNNLISANS
ncbi:triose-phosphate isomerase [Candidatus Cytomitobacter primus]|nr:triose-phosphate isomerase [Candidatus Cytomitobacter primus]